jgi:hypothetical protein
MSLILTQQAPFALLLSNTAKINNVERASGLKTPLPQPYQSKNLVSPSTHTTKLLLVKFTSARFLLGDGLITISLLQPRSKTWLQSINPRKITPSSSPSKTRKMNILCALRTGLVTAVCLFQRGMVTLLYSCQDLTSNFYGIAASGQSAACPGAIKIRPRILS